jgi:hypothetical protein
VNKYLGKGVDFLSLTGGQIAKNFSKLQIYFFDVTDLRANWEFRVFKLLFLA